MAQAVKTTAGILDGFVPVLTEIIIAVGIIPLVKYSIDPGMICGVV